MAAASSARPAPAGAPLYQFEAEDIAGQVRRLSDYQGSVLLIVNTASQCSFTPQYQGLQQLFEQYKSRGFIVLAFPCNQFGGQEPGSAADIQGFCSLRYQVKFPLFAKVDVKGEAVHPLFAYLSQTKPGLFGTTHIKWNFTKFLVDRQGRVVQRFPPHAKPSSLAPAIERLL